VGGVVVGGGGGPGMTATVGRAKETEKLIF
jgi:hypothetical protein